MRLQIQRITKTFRTGRKIVPAVMDASLEVSAGSCTVILGPSGCGKSTLLRIIAGLELPDTGELFLDGEDITGRPPEKRKVGIVFQEDSLFPGMRLAEQILWAMPTLESTKRPRFLEELLRLGGMEHLSRRFPHEMSGGERQRGTILRALAAQPRLLLLDEPFSRLDAPLRNTLRRDLQKILRSTGTTSVLVTHDQEEALAMADQLVIMDKGRFLQAGHPHEIYARPLTAFIAGFLGRANILQAEAEGDVAMSELGRLELERPARGTVTLMVRPEHWEMLPGKEFRILDREFRGHDVTWRLDHRGREILVHTDWESDFEPGQTVDLRLRRPAVVLEEPPD